MKDFKIDFLEQIISSPSVNGTEGEENLAKLIYNIFKSNGFNPILQPVGDAFNVILKIEGKSDRIIIWNGHMDTVPVGDISNWNTDPYVATVIDDYIYGRGASDMKGGLAAQIVTIILNKDIIPENTIYFVATCDEERGGQGAVAFLEEYKDILEKAKLVIIGEPTNMKLGIAQKGCLWIEFTVRGKTSHGANPSEGINAIEESYKLYNIIKEDFQKYSDQLLGHSTVSITKIESGIANNVIPDLATFVLDIRYTESIKDIFKYIEKLVLNSKVDVVEFKTINHRIPVTLSKESSVLCRFEEITGIKEKIGITYFTDSSVWCQKVTDLAVVLFSAGCKELAHKPNECISLTIYNYSIELYNKIYRSKI